MVTVDKIGKRFKNDFWAPPIVALEDVSFAIEAGQLVGFLGANGAGKTTLLKIIMGFIFQSSGQVRFSPALGENRNEILKNVGFLPERPFFYPHLTGMEFLNYMGELQHLPRQERERQIGTLSEQLNIAHALKRKIRTYSKGMLQRLGVVSVLLHNPRLIILDEPLSGLDPIGRKEFKDALSSLHRSGKTVFFSSHIVPDVEEICNSVVILEKGKLLFHDTLETLYEREGGANYHIHTPQEVLEVSAGTKEQVLGELLTQGRKINRISPARETLEQIIYKIK